MTVFIVKSKENTINSVDEWYQYAPPSKGSVHWKDGKSAKELAKFIIENDGGNRILKYLGICFDGVVICYPEHNTSLPYKGRGRSHDLLLVAEDNSFLIGVEAKTDESFGEYCNSIKNLTENRKARTKELCDIVFSDKNFDISNLRYQLLSATAGTLIESKNRAIKNTYFLALTLDKKGIDYNSKQIAKNEKDFIMFDNAQNSLNMNYMKIIVE